MRPAVGESGRGEGREAGRVLRLSSAAGEWIRAHAQRDYPNECCGLMVGRRDGEAWQVEYARPARNLTVERAGDRFLLDPADFVRVDREARGSGLDIIGVYHSHPDHPAQASETDRENAWPALAYLIVGVRQGRAEEWRVWEYDGEIFHERNLARSPRGTED